MLGAPSVAGPGPISIADPTQVAAMQQTASYAPDWESRFNASMSSAPGVRVAFSTGSAVVYTLNWPPGARFVPPVLDTGTQGPARFGWTRLGLIWFAEIIALLVGAELVHMWRPRARWALAMWIGTVPLLVLFLGDVILRFVVLS